MTVMHKDELLSESSMDATLKKFSYDTDSSVYLYNVITKY